MNLGYFELASGEGVTIRVYYDKAWMDTDPTRDPMLAPLVNGPRGYCLDLTNLTGAKASISMIAPDSSVLTMTVQQGDPVTTGPTSGRSRTAAQMGQLGFLTRGDVSSFQLV